MNVFQSNPTIKENVKQNFEDHFAIFILKTQALNKKHFFYILTSVFRDFVDVLSGRTVVGHDANGNLVLFHVDGQTEIRG